MASDNLLQGDPNMDMSMDAGQLFREEVITDRRVGTIRRLIPIDGEGRDDAGRPVSYVGQAQIMTAAGPLPLSFEIEADTLTEAVEQFAVKAEEAVHSAVEELKEMRRQAASSIVIPGAEGGVPGGGKFQMP